MKKLLTTATLAAAFLVLATANLQAQTRVNPNLYRQNLTRTSPQPLNAFRGSPSNAATFNNFIPGVGFVTPYNTYVNPAITYPSYSVYPSYYSNTLPSYYPSYYQNTYPSFYPSYTPYVSPGYVNPGILVPYYYGY